MPIDRPCLPFLLHLLLLFLSADPLLRRISLSHSLSRRITFDSAKFETSFHATRRYCFTWEEWLMGAEGFIEKFETTLPLCDHPLFYSLSLSISIFLFFAVVTPRSVLFIPFLLPFYSVAFLSRHFPPLSLSLSLSRHPQLRK